MSRVLGNTEPVRVNSSKELKEYLEDNFSNIKAVQIHEYYEEQKPTLVVVVKFSVWSLIFYKSSRENLKELRSIIAGLLPEDFAFELIISVI